MVAMRSLRNEELIKSLTEEISFLGKQAVRFERKATVLNSRFVSLLKLRAQLELGLCKPCAVICGGDNCTCICHDVEVFQWKKRLE